MTGSDRLAPLQVRSLLAGSRLVVVGGTGFLGKVWLAMVLYHIEEVDHLYLMVRPRKDRNALERFWAEIAPSPVFDPLREKYPGLAFEAFLQQKITPIPGDVGESFAGVPQSLRDHLRGNVTAVVNVAGVVDFNPPLDEALSVNAFGMQQLVALARDLGDVPFLHTSTCYVAGDRTGQVDEVNPQLQPFPKASKLDTRHWSPAREISECEDVIRAVRHRAADAFRQTTFLATARENLEKKGEPGRGSPLEDEVKRVRRAYEEKELIAAGTERAKVWGWHNIYTYTKAIGEQILCESGLQFTICRPAVIESAVLFPSVGWNEGINTSAPLIYLGLAGTHRFPAEEESVMDFIPVDMVAAGMVLALAELLEGRAPQVYQMGSSDSNPCKMHRLIELVGLYKRRHYQNKSSGNPIFNWVQRQYEAVPYTAESYWKYGPHTIEKAATGVAGLLKRTATELVALKPLLTPVSEAASGLAVTASRTAYIMDQFVPFMATHNYRFSCRNVRAAYARLEAAEQALFAWNPETIDWRHYMLEVHIPGLEKNVLPELDDRVNRPVKPLRRHDTLLDLIEDGAERHDRAAALMLTQPDGFARVSFRDLRERARATAMRLREQGVMPQDRVLLSGANHPDWVVAWFGIQYAGAVAVPLDPGLGAEAVANIARTAEPRLGIFDAKAKGNFGSAVEIVVDLETITAPMRADQLRLPHIPHARSDVASILFTSGTTGQPKGVVLTHENFSALLASLGRLFPLKPEDRVLSVLPLHHTFEFTCGLLLPLSAGAQVIYLDELTGERLTYGLQNGQVTAMVGVPAVWQLLERRIHTQVRERGKWFEVGFDLGLEANRMLGQRTGLDAGRLLFAFVHQRLGGNIRLLISGGAALPKDTHQFFAGLGLHLAEGYGLTEASPVLTVSKGGPGEKYGNVGKAIPGVQIRILNPDANGVGEVLARGANVMQGYYANEESTRAVLDSDGWLHTGDLGRMDPKGRLIIVGRAKDVVVTASGENIYLDDLEARLGTISGVKEYTTVGIPDPRGGERLALLAVPDLREDEEPARGRIHARNQLKEALAALPPGIRPAVVELQDELLPRTASMKVKRREVQNILAAMVQSSEEARVLGGSVGTGTARAVARVAGVEPDRVHSGTRIREDLGFDSLMWTDLSVELEATTGNRPSVEALARCETVAEVELLLRRGNNAALEPRSDAAEETEEVEEKIRVPDLLVGPLKQALGQVQHFANGTLLDTRVTGRAFIPQNRPALVVSNHSSHLDMGLVKYALGDYGSQMVSMAAADYFFEGNKWWVAYWEQLTNLRPLDRQAGIRASYNQARTAVEEGNVVLIFPEGTRQPDGRLGPFKPMVGKLALETGRDVLPVFLDGTNRILPKGASLPKGRGVEVRIGPPIRWEKMQAWTDGLKPNDAARLVTRVMRDAVAALRDGRLLDPETLRREDLLEDRVEVDPNVALFQELPGRFIAGVLEEPTSWYFSLGDGEHSKWTVIADKDKVEVKAGKPSGGVASCVVKTSPGMMEKIIREAYAPDPAEFIGGTIKTNDIPLLMQFAQSFRLGAA